jgi:hypothetical protein
MKRVRVWSTAGVIGLAMIASAAAPRVASWSTPPRAPFVTGRPT